jgi:hypothetical protein
MRIIKTARTEKAINDAVEQGFRALVRPVIPSPDIRAKFAISQDKATGKIRVAHDFRDQTIIIKPLIPELFNDLPSPTREEMDSWNLKLPDEYRNAPITEYETVIGWTDYYPYNFESPFAAYLIPTDIQIGEKVMLEDLIEDVVGARWNQGDTFRMPSCAAIWTGQDFTLVYEPIGNRETFIG